MNEHQRQLFWANIYQTPDEVIVDYIFKGDITKDELKEKISLERYKGILSLIDSFVNKEFESMFNKIKDNIEDTSSEEYKKYDNNHFSKLVDDKVLNESYANQLAQILQNRINLEIEKEQRVVILKEMREGHPNYKISTIKNLIDKQIIFKADLKELGLNDQEIKRIDNYHPEPDDNRDKWGKIPPLRNDSTDVYLFGKGSSGKSSLFAAMLYVAQRRGILRPDTNNMIGYDYMDIIINRISQGGLPQRTSVDHLNYISVDLRNKIDKYHRINFIEMSGEHFERFYDDPDYSSNIVMRDFLKNKNNKIIFFVIDYTAEFFLSNEYTRVSNQAVITKVLLLLSKDGTLALCDSLNIIVTKSDLISRDYQEAKNKVENYVMREYHNVYRLCLEYQHKFNIKNFNILPSSLGHFILPDIYRFDPTFSNEILNLIINNSRMESQGFFKKLIK